MERNSNEKALYFKLLLYKHKNIPTQSELGTNIVISVQCNTLVNCVQYNNLT